MTKQAVLDAVALKCGDTSTAFKTNTLSPVFAFLLAELATAGVLPMLRKIREATFLTASTRTYNTSIVTGLAAVEPYIYPATIWDIFCYSYGLGNQPEKVTPQEMQRLRLVDGNTLTADRITAWTLYPNEQTLVVHPIPTVTCAAYTHGIEYQAPPTVIADNAEITELHVEDLFVLYAGFYRHGVRFIDEAIQDIPMAEALWNNGITLMKSRIYRSAIAGRPVRVAYKDF